MPGFQAFAFTAPWVLAALAALPLVWWLARVMPPVPRRVVFPAMRLLFGLRRDEQTPARAPLWLMIARTLLAALAIIGLAGPVLHPAMPLPGSGPLIVVVDNGWAAAPHWTKTVRIAAARIDLAAREDRPVVVLATAPEADGNPADAVARSAADARRILDGLSPKPWPTGRAAALARLRDSGIGTAATVEWFSDGLTDTDTETFAETLQRYGSLRVHMPGETRDARPRARLLDPPAASPDGVTMTVRRAPTGLAETATVLALGDRGQVYARLPVSFAPDSGSARVEVPLPNELRDKLARFEIENEPGAGAVTLLDDRWRRRSVALVSAGGGDGANLLAPLFYLDRALEPYADLRRGALGDLLDRPPSVMVLADTRVPAGGERDRLVRWIEDGGVLVRFLGPRTAVETDPLLPVKLRAGGRALGGVMSWVQAMRIAPFDDTGPFGGLVVPDDVLVRSQVLAEPSVDLADKTWARLEDGTPLVTGAARGRGWIVLIHTTADPAWSDLPISGLFVDMLRRLLALGAGEAGAGDRPLTPWRLLDGFGRLTLSGDRGAPLTPPFDKARAGPLHPPGYYGSDDQRRALNLAPAVATLDPLVSLPFGVVRSGYDETVEQDLAGIFLALAVLLWVVDIGAGLWLAGTAPRLRRAGRVLLSIWPWGQDESRDEGRDGGRRRARRAGSDLMAALVVAPALLLAAGTGARAAPDDRTASLATRLAYIETGNARADDDARRGLAGLSRVVNDRTAVELETPVSVTPDDKLVFYPMIYWIVVPGQPFPSPDARRNLRDYLRSGGLVVFDTRGSAPDASDTEPRANDWLRRLLSEIEVPRLVTLPKDHVLRRTFYLLDDLPGRWTGGRVWVEEEGASTTDNVTSVVIVANDWAGAWAETAPGQPIYPVVPGGERQREMAYRAGVNLLMHALTGNYKTDQVHVGTLLDRLGR